MSENEEKKNTAAELTDEQLEQATGGSDIWDYIGIQDRRDARVADARTNLS